MWTQKIHNCIIACLLFAFIFCIGSVLAYSLRAINHQNKTVHYTKHSSSKADSFFFENEENEDEICFSFLKTAFVTITFINHPFSFIPKQIYSFRNSGTRFKKKCAWHIKINVLRI